MKKTLILIYSFCALVIIAGGIAWFVVMLQSDSAHAKETAVQQLQGFAKRTAAILDEQHVNDALKYYDVQDQLVKLCSSYRTYIQAVLITDQNQTLFKWPQNTNIFSQDIHNTVTIKHSPLFDTPVQIMLPAEGEQNRYTLYASLPAVSIHTVFMRGKIVFWLIFVVFIFTAVLLILSYMYGLSSKPNTEEKRIEFPDVPVQQVEIPRSTVESVLQEAEAAAAPQESSVAGVPVQSSGSDIEQQLESLNKLHISENLSVKHVQELEAEQAPEGLHKPEPEQVSGTEQEDPEQQTEASDAVTAEYADPMPHEESNYTQVQTESNDRARLIEALDDAITHTTVSEEDVTLLLVRLKGITQNRGLIQFIKTKLDKINKIIPFDEDTLSIILYYTPLPKGMHIANMLYEQVRAFLDSTSSTERLSLGLTTRAGRLIPAHRMIEEAQAALHKTWEEETDPIVAFRVNPAKYRQYIAKNY